MTDNQSPSGERTPPLLAACLIVKNEEHHLGPCLESLDALRPLIGDVCVYDTGSTDNTVAIARAHGARVVEGFWDGDFSRARNESLAMTDAMWALIVDADERVVADAMVVRRLLENAGDVDVFNANLNHLDDGGKVIGRSSYGALLRIAAVRYVRRVHEVAVRADGAPVRAVQLTDGQLMFTHYGYATPEVRRAKAERNAAAAAADVDAALIGGDDQALAEALYHHARSIMRFDDPQGKAVPELERAWGLFAPASVGRERALAILVPELLRCGRHRDATAWVREHLNSGGAPAHARLLVARIALSEGRPEDALSALSGIPDEGSDVGEVDPRAVLDARIDALDALERSEEAMACCVLLVTRWADLSRLRDTLHRVSSHDAAALASLLIEPPTAVAAGDLEVALRAMQEPFASEVADQVALLR